MLTELSVFPSFGRPLLLASLNLFFFFGCHHRLVFAVRHSFLLCSSFCRLCTLLNDVLNILQSLVKSERFETIAFDKIKRRTKRRYCEKKKDRTKTNERMMNGANPKTKSDWQNQLKRNKKKHEMCMCVRVIFWCASKSNWPRGRTAEHNWQFIIIDVIYKVNFLQQVGSAHASSYFFLMQIKTERKMAM